MRSRRRERVTPMLDRVKRAARRSPDGPKESEDTFISVNCITPESPFDQAIVDAVFDEIASILTARTARLRGAFALLDGVS